MIDPAHAVEVAHLASSKTLAGTTTFDPTILASALQHVPVQDAATAAPKNSPGAIFERSTTNAIADLKLMGPLADPAKSRRAIDTSFLIEATRAVP